MIDLDIILEASEEKRGTKMWLECGNLSYCDINELILRLRQAEKDAARYRWIKENSQFGVGRCGVDWELYFEGPAPDNSAMIELHIDEAMQCK